MTPDPQMTPPGDELAEAVAAANVPVLLMVLVHLTGDKRWLRAPYRPTRNLGLGDNPTGGLPEDVQEEIRQAAAEAIRGWMSGRPIALPPERMQPEEVVEMLSVSMGEPVPAEYGPMLMEELVPPAVPAIGRREDRPRRDLQVVVIGAGLAGVAAGAALGDAGVSYTILERGAGLGGTWLENRYPGCAVDTPGAIYAYSFAPHAWNRHFPDRDEVLSYIERTARERGVHDHIRFGAEVVRAEYREEDQRWRVAVRDAVGELTEVVADVVISAVGAFTRPKLPAIPGLDGFAGPVVHTARWPSELDLRGKRVGVIGNGASAMQLVPAVADEVEELVVFQRSPQWVAPFPYLHAEIPRALSLLTERVPLYGRWTRLRWAWTFSDRLHAALQKDPAWAEPARAVNEKNDAHRVHLTRYLESELGERPELRAALLPDYPPFGKRILLDNGWYRTFLRDHVALVTDPVARIDGSDVVGASGERHRLDVLVCATGFDVVRFLAPIEIIGREGRAIRDVWEDDDARAFLGTAVPGFPNFFMLFGPNVQPGHGGSVVGIVEMQVRYVMQLLERLCHDGLGAVEVRREVWERYNREVDTAHANMIWTHPGMSTYYRNSRGRVVLPSPFRIVDLWQRMHEVDLGDYLATAVIPTPAAAATPAAGG